MVTLTTPHGEFSADTEKEALALSRKAQREARKTEKEKENRREAARAIAFREGFRIYSFAYRAEGVPSGWRLYRTGERYSPSVNHPDMMLRRSVVTFHNCHGSGQLELYGWELASAVMDGAGFYPVIFLQDMDNRETPPDAYAVGVSEGEVVIERMEGITETMFPRSKQAE